MCTPGWVNVAEISCSSEDQIAGEGSRGRGTRSHTQQASDQALTECLIWSSIQQCTISAAAGHSVFQGTVRQNQSRVV